MKSKITNFKKKYSNRLLKISLLCTLLSWQINYSQNTCATATPVTAGLITIDAINGTNIATSCSTPALAEWYAYTPSQNYSVTVTSDLSQNICKDTDFEVYTGTCGSLICYSGDDDDGVIQCNSGNTNSYLSVKTFDAIAGTTYYICWTNRWSAAGFDFQLIENTNPCLSATPITAGITTVDAINQTNITTACSTSSLAKWYSYTPTQDYEVTITSDLIENICKDTNFSVYTGSCSSLACFTSDDNSGVIQCNAGNTNSNLSTKTFIVTGGTTYYIAWDNKWSAAGFNFQLIENIIPPPPVSYTTQTITTINSGYNICVVDMNGDYKDDIVGVDDNNLRIHYQGAPGTFSITDFPITGTSKMPSWSLAAGDYNRDNYNDLILGSSSGLSVWTSNSTGTAYTSYTPGENVFCQRTNFADLNNDGNLDVFSCHDIAPNVYYLNNGNGNLTYYQSSVTPGAMSVGSIRGNYATLFTDFDNDGDTDLFVSKCSGPTCELHRNDGNGVYTNISAIAQINITPIQSWSSAIADFDNDGDMDILIGSNGNTGHVFFKNNLDTSNNVEEAFTNITAGSGWDNDTTTNRDYVAYDFDNDGYVDVLGSGNKIMFNQGNNIFAPVVYTAGIGVGAIGDLNNDGFLDILNGNTVKYAVPNGNNWIKITLKGVQSNSNGIGARVEIYGAWGKQIRDIRSGEGFEYMSSLNAHFGIGTETNIIKVIIRWPSGVVDAIDNPSSNQVLNVIEGSFPLSIPSYTVADFKIYPNPSSDFITISNIEKLQVSTISLYTSTGKLIRKIKDASKEIKISDLQEGLYILNIETINGEKFSQNFLKKN